MLSPVYLLRLHLQDFRNHRATRLAPGAMPFVILTGANGAGKTNILEAVSLLSVGRGLRQARLSDMAAREGAGGFHLRAELLPDAQLPPVRIDSFTTAEAPDRRQLRVNEAAARLSTLSDWSSQLWLTPSMDRLFADPAAARRRFLDRLVLALDPAHGRHASRYETAMRNRNRLLQQDAPPDPVWLDALEREMALHGAVLSAARLATVTALNAALCQRASDLFPRPALALLENAPDGQSLSHEAGLRQLLRSHRPRDLAAGRSTQGPHRADMQVIHADKDMPAGLASTGEQKALLIAILLAHARLVGDRSGRAPLLLLDEVAAHLDADRRQALFAAIATLGSQAWMTGTDPQLFQGLDAAIFRIASGEVQKS